MLQLGQTRDPKALVPGEPSKLDATADKLDTYAEKLDGIGDRLGAVRIPGWTGKASDGFWDDFSGQKKRWYRGSDSLGKTATALRDYAGTLEWAQTQADDAIRKFEKGDEDEATSILKTARERVESAGERATKKFEAQDGGAGDAPDWLFWSQGAASSEGKTSKDVKQQEYGGLNPNRPKTWGDFKDLSARDREELRDQTKGNGPGISVAGPSVSGKANVWGEDVKGRGEFAGGDVSGKAGVELLGVEGQAGVGARDGNATASASAKAYLAQATAEGKYEAGYFAASGKANASAAAEAAAQGSIGKDGVHAEASAAAVARASAEGHADVAGIGAGVKGEAWAGAGAEAKFDSGFNDEGKFVIGAEAGIGLGVGAKLGGSIEIDPGKVSDAVSDGVDAVGDFAGDAKDTVTGWFD
ncbi:putative T7SS-secreted protein [Streptomyces sp. HNM0574]|uniref:putative T7SS-secreted protein n=1 Tax=Streptomyces sp. HNM0574 TaxID=2714954 RepID=UPI00146A7209|nr:hypothetical protein [Streptomyces sp. HNM0574]NLU66525.1 hypothetical protein [Streptomyces sp. HNM0574]